MERPEVSLYIPVAHAVTTYESLWEALGFVQDQMRSAAVVSDEATALAWDNARRWALAWATLNDLRVPYPEIVRHARAFLSEHSEEYLAWESRQEGGWRAEVPDAAWREWVSEPNPFDPYTDSGWRPPGPEITSDSPVNQQEGG